MNLMRSGNLLPNFLYTFFPTNCSLASESSFCSDVPAKSPLEIIDTSPGTPDISQLSPIPSCDGSMFLNFVISDPPQITDFSIGSNFNGYSVWSLLFVILLFYYNMIDLLIKLFIFSF